jgi:hypothetical protein
VDLQFGSRVFLRVFYRKLLDGANLDAAFTAARAALGSAVQKIDVKLLPERGEA